VTAAAPQTITVNGSATVSAAEINNAGVVTGSALAPSGEYHAFVWSLANGGKDLGTLGGSFSWGRSINAGGDVAGYTLLADNTEHAFVSFGGDALQDLGTLSPSNASAFSAAYGINDQQQVVGGSTASDGQEHAFLWTRADGMRDLGTLGLWSQARAISNSGAITGVWAGSDGNQHVFLWKSDAQGMQDLGTFGGTWAYPTAINTAGYIAGYVYFGATDSYRGFVYDPTGQVTLIGTLPGTILNSIDGQGDAVGYDYDADGNQHAILWSAADGLQDLASLTGVAYLQDVNDNRQAISGNLLLDVHYNTPPVALNVTAQTVTNTPIAVTLAGSDPDNDVITYSIVTAPQHGSLSGDAPSYSYTPTTGYEGNDSFTYAVTDTHGASARGTTTITIVPPNHPPVAAAGGNDVSHSSYLGVEGLAVAFDGSASTDADHDALSYTWDFGDKSAPVFSWSPTASHSYADNGSYTATLTVTDSHGAASTVTVPVVISDLAPAVTVGPATTITSGDVYTLDGSFSDPGVNDRPWSYAVNWGTGLPTAGSTSAQGTITASTRYLAAGTWTVTLDVTDKDHGIGSASTTVTVLRLEVGLDIKPGDVARFIKLNDRSHGDVPVAVLSSSSFDAHLVDVSSVRIGNAAVAKKHNGTYMASYQDVNRDGRPDLVLHFNLWDLISLGELNASSRSLTLLANLTDGRQIAATAVVRPM
jgi:probable HAF family extracellular repeat protein